MYIRNGSELQVWEVQMSINSEWLDVEESGLLRVKANERDVGWRVQILRRIDFSLGL